MRGAGLALVCAGVAGVIGASSGVARAEGTGLFAQSCVQGYAQAFGGLNAAAGALRLKADTAEGEVKQIFREAPPRCEVGAYGYYLEQLLTFVRRAMRSGTSPQTPKDGFMRAAAAAAGYGPKSVPQAEYYDDMQRFQVARREVVAMATEAGLGPLPVLVLAAFDRATPAPGAYGPAVVPAAPAVPVAPAGTPQAGWGTPQVAPARPAPAPGASPSMPVRLVVPAAPLPDWAVVSLHEMKEQVRTGREAEALLRLNAILRWVEAQ
jgi:hypothetical protein